MKTEHYNVVGVMSGTSLDGIDLAHLSLSYSEQWHFEILEAETISYSKVWKEQLKNAITYSEDKLLQLNEDYTTYLSEIITSFIEKNNLKHLDTVCSHGHTILHQPEKELTLQIGNLPKLAKQINQTVVCDFRVQDVTLGGQGAPLVPIGDQLLFGKYDYCLNLGGFANVSEERNGKRIAYDICPVNTVLNHYTETLGFDYDKDGKIASEGSVNTELIKVLNQLEFYAQPTPKSLGMEWVIQHIFPLIDSFKISVIDKISTFTEHCALQIASALQKKKADILVTGGGAFNTHLIERIKVNSNSNLHLPDAKLINYKEALIFGLLGVLKLQGIDNVISSVTGASRNHSSGKIFQP